MFHITPIQVIAILFAFFAISRVFLRLKDGNITRKSFIFWSVLWIIMILIAFFPEFTTNIAKLVGIEKGVNLVVSLSIIGLFYLIFRLYVKVEGVEQEISKLVRQMTFDKKKGKK